MGIKSFFRKIIFKIIFAAAAVLLLAPSAVLFSCSSGGGKAKPDIIPGVLPDISFGGYNFKIYAEEDHYGDLYAEEGSTGDIINDAVYARNKAVEERFDITISPVFYSSDWNRMMDGEKAILSGANAFDLMSLHGRVAFAYADRNLLADWFEHMSYIDFSAPWWNAEAVAELSVGGRLYFASGDLSYTGLSSAVCLIFNKDLFLNLNIEYPYGYVADGTWTLDKFIAIVKSGAADLSGKGALSPDSGRYGFDMISVWHYPTAVVYCGGDRVMKKDELTGEHVFALFSERTADILDKFFDMLGSGAAVIAHEEKRGNPDGIEIFRDGRALFTDGGMDNIIRLRAMEQEIGILPVPKYDESTPKYYTLVEAYARMIAVPVTQEDFIRTSIITEALSIGGYETVIPEYYEKALKTKYSRDYESAEMLDYIRDGRVFDFGYLNEAASGVLASVGAALVREPSPDFASFYERHAGASQSGVNYNYNRREGAMPSQTGCACAHHEE
jgi:hypothetical protein